MREVITEVEAWREAGRPIAIATNVKREGSSLRPLGAKMAMTTSLKIAGSVTGGCIESAVYEEGQEVIKTSQPKLLHYNATSGEDTWEVGLSCGGSLDVFVESMDSPAWREIYPALKVCLEENQTSAVATVISGPGLGKKLMLWPDGHALGSMGNKELDLQTQTWMKDQIALQNTTWTTFTIAGEKIEVFVEVLAPPARLIVIGAVHIAIPLVTLAKVLGYQTIVIDPREAFATRERFPKADELIVEWPSTALEKLHLDQSTYIAAVTHDGKIDNPALKIALASPARYVGVLGAQKKIAERFAALRELGVTDEQLSRLHSPIGIDLGAVQLDEIALSILAEMVITRHEPPKLIAS